MLDPDKAGAWLEHHFATVTPEEFIANVRRVSPESARELWGDLSAAEILARRDQARHESDDFPYGAGARPSEFGEGAVVGPERARAVAEEYYATASDRQIVEDLRRFSPELARRLGVASPGPVRQAGPSPGTIRGLFSSFRRSVLRIFS